MTKDNRYDNYTQLLTKVDEMFAGVVSRYPGQFACGAGCYGCCQAGLTISHIEASRIGSWLDENPEVVAKISDNSKMLGREEFCVLLDLEGKCSIYEVRPMICRSHGMPVSWAENSESAGSGDVNEAESRDVCPLNFEGVDLGALPKTDVLSLDKLNLLLSLINRKFDEARSGERYPVEDIIGRY